MGRMAADDEGGADNDHAYAGSACFLFKFKAQSGTLHVALCTTQ